MMATAVIEHHPENGSAPHVVVICGRGLDGNPLGPVWFACETIERAEEKRPALEKSFTALGY
jgi:hypothetical protein